MNSAVQIAKRSSLLDAVSTHSAEWGLIGRRLLVGIMSGTANVWPPEPPDASTTVLSTEEGETQGSERRKLRNEDSSYDSDVEASDATHDDVCRTVSETLGAEYLDYVTTSLPSVVQQQAAVTASFAATAEYRQQVEFGVKLGYSESLVQVALLKLGPTPAKDKLLDELIRLDAGAPREGENDNLETRVTTGTAEAPLRPIIIDGSNVAMSHGNKAKFSCEGIRLCVEWFRARGHRKITVFVPSWRKEQWPADAAEDYAVLEKLEAEGVVVFTPSRYCGMKRIVAYDDRYIVKEAQKTDGVVVSNDHYRDLQAESAAFRRVVETSILMYSWVNGRFEPPDDPLGRNGPSLDTFLRMPSPSASASAASSGPKDARPCPYGRKCTYGNKCKFKHPERGTAPVKSVTEMLHEQKQKRYQDKTKSRDLSPGENLRSKSLSLPMPTSSEASCPVVKKPLARTRSNYAAVRQPQQPQQPQQLQQQLQTQQQQVFSSPALSSWPPPPPNPSVSQPEPPKPPTTISGTHMPLQLSPHVSEPIDNSENLHPKLQRQLSINPVGDDRLTKMMGGRPAAIGTHPPTDLLSSLSLQSQQQMPSSVQQSQHRLLENCMRSTPYAQPYGGRDLSASSYMPHSPLTRVASQEPPSMAYSSRMLFHNPVGRNLSAPDPIRGGAGTLPPPQGQMPRVARLNSTSDSRLNLLHSDVSFSPDCFSPLAPVGTRPLSPPTVTNSMEDERLKIFYHLSQLFPEAQVRAALARHPDERDPTKICMAILCAKRPVSPQPPPPPPQTLADAARIEAYAALNNLFPEQEDRIRSLFLHYPEETDAAKLLMLLTSGQSSMSQL